MTRNCLLFFLYRKAAKRGIRHDSGQIKISTRLNSDHQMLQDLRCRPRWTSKPTYPPPPLIPHSQPSSQACQSGRSLTGAFPGSSACCLAPSGFSSARWCWPDASTRHPATYPRTTAGGRTKKKEERTRQECPLFSTPVITSTHCIQVIVLSYVRVNALWYNTSMCIGEDAWMNCLLLFSIDHWLPRPLCFGRYDCIKALNCSAWKSFKML